MSTRSQTFTASGTFNVPVGVTAVWVTACGGGTGGNGYAVATGNPSHGSGGSGEFCLSRLVPVTSGGTLAITVGAGSAGAVGSGASAAASPTQFGTFSVLGGKTMRTGASFGGDGGGVSGGLSAAVVKPNFLALVGGRESISSFGGTAGPAHDSSLGPQGAANAFSCAGAAGTGSGNVGTGGSALVWPSGGNGNDTGTTPGSAATGWGAGGGGCGQSSVSLNGGDGASGAVVVSWTQP